MPNTVENKLDELMHEIRDIKKALILDRTSKRAVARDMVTAWGTLGQNVSARWDKISALDEIRQQREKTW
jgi:hypothetical protein